MATVYLLIERCVLLSGEEVTIEQSMHGFYDVCTSGSDLVAQVWQGCGRDLSEAYREFNHAIRHIMLLHQHNSVEG